MKRETKGLTSIATTRHASTDPALQRQIAERAYQLFEMRGHSHGSDVEDWLRAERDVRATWGRKATSGRSKSAMNGRSRPKTPKAA
jgi:hypothetical protein